jgi:hypothetical protein
VFFHHQTIALLGIVRPISFGDLGAQFVNLPVQPHQAQGIDATVRIGQRFVERLCGFVYQDRGAGIAAAPSLPPSLR